MQKKTIPFTQKGYEDIKKEQEVLSLKRAETLKSVIRAREMGDLSENALYKAAKMELGQIDRRLRHITHLLTHAQIITAKSNESVTIGVSVTLDDGSNKRVLSIVGGFESNPIEGKISDQSPLGKALIGKKVGDSITFQTPRGQMTYSIQAITLV